MRMNILGLEGILSSYPPGNDLEARDILPDAVLVDLEILLSQAFDQFAFVEHPDRDFDGRDRDRLPRFVLGLDRERARTQEREYEGERENTSFHGKLLLSRGRLRPFPPAF
jgi:hypothetical protein